MPIRTHILWCSPQPHSRLLPLRLSEFIAELHPLRTPKQTFWPTHLGGRAMELADRPRATFWRFSLITQFKGQYEFLDPAYHCLAEYDGVIYNSAEAAFLAAQFDAPYFRSMFRNPALPIWRARELSKKLQKRRDWTPDLSLEIMWQITLDKFSRSRDLRSLLLATCDERVIAENNWHEQFWGCCICDTRPGKYGRRFSCLVPGHNYLGEILMAVRDQLQMVARAG